MEKLTPEALPKSKPPTSKDSTAVTSSAESRAGTTPSNSPDGQRIITDSPSGPDLVLANPSVSPVLAKARPTNAISGQSSTASSESVALTSFLASRLRARMDVNGSPEYTLTWKIWDIPSGLSIPALRASRRRTSDNAFTGWRSPDSNDRGGAYTDPAKVVQRIVNGHQVNLEDQAVLTGWTTPQSHDSQGMSDPSRLEHHGTKHGCKNLNDESGLRGWASPSARDWKDTPGMATEATNPDGSLRARIDQLPRQAALAGWTTPSATDGELAGTGITKGMSGSSLAQQSAMTSGPTTTPSPAPTEKRGALNPAFPRWLQGFPREWCIAAIRAHRQMRTTRRKPAR